MRFLKLFLVLSLSFTLFGCESEDNSQNEAFEKFMAEIPTQILESDDLTINQLIDQPSKYHLKSECLNWEAPNLEKFKKDQKILKKLNKKLTKINYDKLSEKNQVNYDVLSYSLRNHLSAFNLDLTSYFYLANKPLGKYNGVLKDIPLSFIVLDFKNNQDINSYLHLLETLPEYLSNLAAFEQERQNKGFGMTRKEIEATKNDVALIANMDNKWLVDDFDQKIKNCDFLDDNEKAHYKQLFGNVVNNFNLAFANLNNYIGQLDIKTKDNTHLADYHKGREYYRYLVYENSGFNKIKDYKSYLDSKLSLPNLSGSLIGDIKTIDYKNLDIENLKLINSDDANEILKKLEKRMQKDFPKIKATKYNMEVIPDALKPIFDGIGALYLPSEVDDRQVSEQMMLADSFKQTDFTTIAHEGYPGHMYQHVYYKNYKHPLIRDLLSFDWYSEGYANYVQRISVNYADNVDNAKFVEINNNLSYFLILQLDYLINYENNYDKALVLYKTRMNVDDATAREGLDQIIWNPGAFIPYYVGGTMLFDIANDLGYSYDNHNLKKFNEALLKIGPAPAKVVYKWLKRKLDKV